MQQMSSGVHRMWGRRHGYPPCCIEWFASALWAGAPQYVDGVWDREHELQVKRYNLWIADMIGDTPLNRKLCPHCVLKKADALAALRVDA